jgi:phenylacetate-CoA ligase
MTVSDTAWARMRVSTRDAVLAGMAEHVARMTWDRQRIARTQRQGLCNLLRTAVDHSPFHRRRLAGIDVEAIAPEDLSSLPVMTKTDMMDALDDVFTDPRLRQADIEAALAVTHDQPVPILDQYVALASGGSSGRRGVVVHDNASLAGFLSAVIRPSLTRVPTGAEIPGEPITMAMVAAPSAVHATGLLGAFAAEADGPGQIHMIAATRPIHDIVRELNELRPKRLTAYASMLGCLAAEARAGRLHIAPIEVSSTSETLQPEIRSAAAEAFGLPVLDGFGSTEGLVGMTPLGEDVLEFNSDMCIVELVDADNHPVRQGLPAAKVLLTNLYNLTQPLIRYELNDMFTRQPDSPHHGHLRATVHGRSDDILHYHCTGTDIHPIAITSVMTKHADVTDYQIRQTPTGIEAFIVATAGADTVRLRTQLRSALANAGLPHPDVTVHLVATVDRTPSGKLRRFIPLP